jgi:hypothetical protein
MDDFAEVARFGFDSIARLQLHHATEQDPEARR